MLQLTISEIYISVINWSDNKVSYDPQTFDDFIHN